MRLNLDYIHPTSCTQLVISVKTVQSDMVRENGKSMNKVYDCPTCPTEEILETMTNKMLEAQGKSLNEVIAAPNLYQASQLPFISIIRQFVSQFHSNTDPQIKNLIKVSWLTDWLRVEELMLSDYIS